MVRCPGCKSGKVYEGYRKPSLLARSFRFHEYLCEHCNLQFQAFSLFSPRKKKRRTQKSQEELFEAFIKKTDEPIVQPSASISRPASKTVNQVRAGVTTTVSVTTNNQSSDQEQPKPGTVKMHLSDLQQQTSQRPHRSRHVCPQCGSIDTERRRRRLWERIVFSFSDVRAYNCRICGTSFYARRKHKSSTESH